MVEARCCAQDGGLDRSQRILFGTESAQSIGARRAPRSRQLLMRATWHTHILPTAIFRESQNLRWRDSPFDESLQLSDGPIPAPYKACTDSKS
jgi:hypothetical protein